MKKSLLALACAVFLGQSAFAQAQEITYVEDPAQGYTFNNFKDNWFITGQGGMGISFSSHDVHLDLKDRFQPAAEIYVGKWFSPIIGLRAGFTWQKTHGLVSDASIPGVQLDQPNVADYYQQKVMYMGPAFDVLLNVTNWWGGYKPNRVYNFDVYGGIGTYWSLARQYQPKATHYRTAHNQVLAARAGIINSFNVSEQVQISLDLRFQAIQAGWDLGKSKITYEAQALLGLTYLFPTRTWTAPIVPVIPEPENCDQYKALLAAADARIADLEAQLKNCLEQPREVEVIEAEVGPIATIYFPINQSRLTAQDTRVVKAVGEIMKQNPNTNYVVTGWADNYTGTAAFNAALRQKRADSVKNCLVKSGVSASQVAATTDAGNLCDMGEKFVSLDRAATITVAE